MAGKSNKGKNGGATGGVSEASKTQGQGQGSSDPQVHPSFIHHGPYIPPYPGPQPTYFPTPGMPGPMYPPFTQSAENGLFELVQEMNDRLKIIETNVTKISTIEKDVSYLKHQVSKLHETNKSLVSRITELESFCETYSDVTDDFITTKRKFQEEFKTVQNNIQSLNGTNNSTIQKCLETQARYMENQLIIFGVDEARPTNSENSRNAESTQRENTEQVFREFLKETIENNPDINVECPIVVNDIKFDKVTRLGNAHQRSTK